MKKDIYRVAADYLVELGVLVPFDEGLQLYAASHETAEGQGVPATIATKEGSSQGKQIVAKGQAYVLSTAALEALSEEQKGLVSKSIAMMENNCAASTQPAVPWEMRAIASMLISGLREAAKGDELYAKTGLFSRDVVKRAQNELAKNPQFGRVLGLPRVTYDQDVIFATADEGIRKVVEQLAASFNAQTLLALDPELAAQAYCARANQDNGLAEVEIGEAGGAAQSVAVSKSQLAGLFSTFGIVGYQQENKDEYTIFDTRKVGEKSEVAAEMKLASQQYDQFAALAGQGLKAASEHQPTCIEYIRMGTADEIMDHFAAEKPLSRLLNASSGVWEGFTVKEHTETLLRWYDRNFAGVLPEELDGMMKIVILSHDIGKGYAFERGMGQKVANAQKAKELYDFLGVPEDMQKLMLFIIGDGQAHTSNYYIRHRSEAKAMMAEQAKGVLKDVLGENPTPEQVEGLWQLCTILQSCDSGAYTRRGITRGKGGVFYYNANDRFGRSFGAPTSLYTDGDLLENE